MKEFINLDEQEIPVIANSFRSLSNIKPDTKVIDGTSDITGATFDVFTINKISGTNKEEDESICVKDDCDVSKYYGCTDGTGAFQVKNLFSELTDEYQRTLARINLGITDEYAMIWGNIKGNLSNQKDLYTFVIDSIAHDINVVVEEINSKLAQWAFEIDERIKGKADINSPKFTGSPTTPLPLLTDDSGRIASTEWVNARIESASLDDNVRAISFSPEYMCYGDEPVDINVVWEYSKEVDEQYLNDKLLDPKVRSYTFYGVNESMVITLRYKYGEITASKVLTFAIKYPIFYGTSVDYTKLDRTTYDTFTVTAKANEYIYVLIPNGNSTSLAVSSIIGGFTLLGTQEVYGNMYYIFKSTNTGLGETTIQVMDQEDFEKTSIDSITLRELLASKADKTAVYSKQEIDDKIAAIEAGDVNLTNYYTKSETEALIPDISNKADREEIPVKVSQLLNDSGFLTEIPTEYITEAKLATKGFLTEELEPAFNASAAKTINITDINNWNNKVDKISGKGLSSQDYTLEEKSKLGALVNYDDTTLRGRVTSVENELKTELPKKANKSDIPDLSNVPLKSDIPTKTSQLLNDSGFLTTMPGGLITEEILESKGYLTEFTETDPTVPAWAKQPNKPIYTATDVGADTKGSADNALKDAKTYTDNSISTITAGAGSSYNTFLKTQTRIEEANSRIDTTNTALANKADKSQLFSGKYSDLSGTPTIPSIEGLATEQYVREQVATIPGVDLTGYAKLTDIPDISTKVDKINGKGLSTNDYTNNEKQKLSDLSNYDDSAILKRLADAESTILGLTEQIQEIQSRLDSLDINAIILE